ncbi:MAG: hypothetical protein ACP5E3_00505, partial [Bacteroidales bacterium]
TNTGLLKICPPQALKPYIPEDYSERVMQVLESRCRILRKYGLKAAFKTFEPQMLPEKVYEDHPLWRGPRVDHPMRSRVARWAPDIDNPDVLELYNESLKILLDRCPEIEILTLTTNDSGTGLSWSGGLYSGKSGNREYKNRRMDERLYSFFFTLQKAAREAGNELEIDIMWTREQFPERIAEGLSKGMAIENLEGPDAGPFKTQVGFLMDYYNFYYPVMGIPQVKTFLDELEQASASQAPRLFVFIGDRYNRELYFDLFDAYNQTPVIGRIPKLEFLREFAEEQIGIGLSENLFNLWLMLGEVNDHSHWVETGGYIYYLGGVQQRWLTRPFIPFPEELKPSEKDYFRKFQFQARTEEHANDMADLQGTRLYSGWSGKFYVHKVMNEVRSRLKEARKFNDLIVNHADDSMTKAKHSLLDKRLEAMILLSNNAEFATSYQAQLDRVKRLNKEPEFRPVVGIKSSWDRSLMLQTARDEIDNTGRLLELLQSTDEMILDLAPTTREKDIRRLGPDFADELKLKMKIMNDHWMDYNRFFTTPRN